MTWVRETEGTPPKPQGWLKPREGSESPLSLLFLPQPEQSLEERIPLEQLPAALSPQLCSLGPGRAQGKVATGCHSHPITETRRCSPSPSSTARGRLRAGVGTALVFTLPTIKKKNKPRCRRAGIATPFFFFCSTLIGCCQIFRPVFLLLSTAVKESLLGNELPWCRHQQVCRWVHVGAEGRGGSNKERFAITCAINICAFQTTFQALFPNVF